MKRIEYISTVYICTFMYVREVKMYTLYTNLQIDDRDVKAYIFIITCHHKFNRQF